MAFALVQSNKLHLISFPPSPPAHSNDLILFSLYRSAPTEKSEAAITQEIQAIIRQITASVTFLPLLNDTCTIDLLAYTDKESEVPFEWYVEFWF
jgi:HORMA domain